MARSSSHGRRGLNLIEVMIATVVLGLAVVGVSAFRYHSSLETQRARIRLTAGRLGMLLLEGWKGMGGHSGYAWYAAADPEDYDPDDPNDYDPSDTDPITFGPGLTVYDDQPGGALPEGFTELDEEARPNYRIVVDGVNYYATMGYKDEDGEPRTLYVCVAWMADRGTWSADGQRRSVSFTTYASQ